MSISKIINFWYKGEAAGLYNPVGPVTITSDNQGWIIVSNGGNYITIQNASTGTYASVSYGSEGAPVFGSPKPYTWQQLSVSGSWYQIATTDGKYVWFLTGPQDGAPIILRGVSYQGYDSQWAYQPVPGVKGTQAFLPPGAGVRP